MKYFHFTFFISLPHVQYGLQAQALFNLYSMVNQNSVPMKVLIERKSTDIATVKIKWSCFSLKVTYQIFKHNDVFISAPMISRVKCMI